MRQAVCVGAAIAFFISGCVGDDGKAVLGGYLQDTGGGEGSSVPEDIQEEESDSTVEAADVDILQGDTQPTDAQLGDTVEDSFVSDVEEVDATDADAVEVDVAEEESELDAVSDVQEEESLDSTEDAEMESDAVEEDTVEEVSDAALEDAEADSEDEDEGDVEDTAVSEEDTAEVIEGFGTPCSENTDCWSGYCIPSADEEPSMICTVLCVDDAGCSGPAYTCSEFESEELSDTVFLCLPSNG